MSSACNTAPFSTSFKLNLSSLDWNLAQLAWLRPRCLYLLATSTFVRRKFLSLEQEGGEDRRCLFFIPTSRRYGEGEGHERLGYPQVVVRYRFLSLDLVHICRQAVHTLSHLLCQMPSHPPDAINPQV